jgi:dephospho-CoA kinase
MKIGVTGGIGSGKSYIVEVYRALGARVYLADRRAKELICQPEVKSRIIASFGPESFSNDTYNIDYISKIVFEDRSKLDLLNSIIHPAVFADFDLFCKENIHSIIVYESALMVETKHTYLFDRIILVTAPLELRIERVMNRDQITREEVLKRMALQSSDSEKMVFADFVIENTEKEKTKSAIEQIWNSNFDIKES